MWMFRSLNWLPAQTIELPIVYDLWGPDSGPRVPSSLAIGGESESTKSETLEMSECSPSLMYGKGHLQLNEIPPGVEIIVVEKSEMPRVEV